MDGAAGAEPADGLVNELVEAADDKIQSRTITATAGSTCSA